MAILLSEDENVKSSFELVFSQDQIKNESSLSWVDYKIILSSAEKELRYESRDVLQHISTGDYVLALTPVNEIENIINGVHGFLKDESKKIFSFEPLEPSFELILERSHKGYSVTCWLDAGNVISDHYTWDGFGIRFFTNKDKIDLFLDKLQDECRDLINQVSMKGNKYA